MIIENIVKIYLQFLFLEHFQLEIYSQITLF